MRGDKVKPLVRIPLTIVAPLGKTDGVICAVMVSDLDALEAENARLAEALEEAQLRSIEARNPGIDMDEVRRSRAAHNGRTEGLETT
jgi:hypothetical protein